MAINPRPPEPGPISFNYRYGPDFQKPSHIPEPDPSIRFADPSLFPGGAPIDTTFDRAAILRSATIPEIMPVMLGLRRYLNERRISKVEDEVVDLEKRRQVIHHVGKSILQHTSYHKTSDSLRPGTSAEKAAASRISKIVATKREVVGSAHGLSTPIRAGKDEHGVNLYPDNLLTLPKNASLGTKVSTARRRSSHNNHIHEAHHLDHKFRTEMELPTLRSGALRADHERLIAKSQAIDEARIKREENRADKRALKEIDKSSIYGSSWTNGTHGFQVTAKNPDGSITITAFDETGPISRKNVRPRNFKAFTSSLGAHF
jgi:hypothetical protein